MSRPSTPTSFFEWLRALVHATTVADPSEYDRREHDPRQFVLPHHEQSDYEAALDTLVDGVLEATTTVGMTLFVGAEAGAPLTPLLAELAAVARRAQVEILGAPTSRHSWKRLVDALYAGPLLVCVADAQSVEPSVLAALEWLSRRFRDRPVAWLFVFRSPDQLGGSASAMCEAVAARAAAHVVVRARVRTPTLLLVKQGG